jgi:hypothetical protein
MSTALMPSTSQRVPLNTSRAVNARIRRQTELKVAHYARRGEEAISRRLAELDAEWDIERTLEANAATAVMVGTVLGTFVDRRFYLFPAVVGVFLLQHAVQGWCPPLPIWRSLGVRTQTEIDEERYALKALRGDFRDVHPPSEGDGWLEVRHAYQAARRT